MQSRILCWIGIGLSFLFLFSACDCDDSTDSDCSNYDPCYGFTEIKADFLMEEYTHVTDSYDWIYYDSDTVYLTSVRFTALEEDADYMWKIGTETINGKVVSRSGFPRGQTIPVTLIVHKDLNQLPLSYRECFPQEDGRDTITRYLHILEYGYCNTKISGEYEGRLNDSIDMTVTISTCKPHLNYAPEATYEDFYLHFSIEPDCHKTASISHSTGLREMHFHSNIRLPYSTSTDCPATGGYAFVNESLDSLTMEYLRYNSETKEYDSYYFKGEKIR